MINNKSHQNAILIVENWLNFKNRNEENNHWTSLLFAKTISTSKLRRNQK